MAICLAPPAGVEPATSRLTAERFLPIELQGKVFVLVAIHTLVSGLKCVTVWTEHPDIRSVVVPTIAIFVVDLKRWQPRFWIRSVPSAQHARPVGFFKKVRSGPTRKTCTISPTAAIGRRFSS